MPAANSSDLLSVSALTEFFAQRQNTLKQIILLSSLFHQCRTLIDSPYSLVVLGDKQAGVLFKGLKRGPIMGLFLMEFYDCVPTVLGSDKVTLLPIIHH